MYSIKLFVSICLCNILLSSSIPILFNKNLDKWTRELLKVSKSEYNNLNEINELTDRKFCGKSLNHLAGLILDQSDREAKLIIEGSITSNKLIFKLGNIKEKEINISDITLPIETLSNKCINIRQLKDNIDSTILCLASKVLRNFWVNSITDAVLCKLTKSKGKLPQFNYAIDNDEKSIDEKELEEKEQEDEELSSKAHVKENEKDQVKKKIINEEFDEEQENKQKGLKLRIAKSKFGQPNIKINGKNIEDIKKEGSEKEKNKLEN
ncbi:PH domain-containing protein [Plasmodium brasilianum]|uniref:PH domain-containing protein, putative n=2 Tax=Plasmodium (Plasmodium) TaxID=418103 RepID=A0A1A8VV37_PLAMA|nr:PH domain-containing protein, putative [Plasmodium malariae]KAI4839285.1 PH domain-containing protein [Plasmodium brasilianum]SBS83540.1 conserved Plasmodium protein, unknown function [Plasmodium malariae]SBT87696.1 PH domain-containing protein, putative [Plasmodium malariae]